VLPISYGDAQPLLAALGGPLAPQEWRGGLPITYRIGPGPAKAHLKLAFNWDIKDVHNVIARIPGSERADQWIVRGNHHDAWVNGAEDPVSGINVLPGGARARRPASKAGNRSAIVCARDSEEPMLLGRPEVEAPGG
jgi:N-acetylated-alpha-linked acidic dipeptidase